MNQEKLIHLLRIAGAPDPESWAASEMQEDIPQLSRFMFLRGLHESVLETDPTGREMRPQPVV